MPYKAKRKFKLKAYKKHASRSRSRKKSSTKAGLVARVGVTSDRKTISLVRTYYLNMTQVATSINYTVNSYFDPLIALKNSPFFQQYIKQYSYCLPMDFTTELIPVMNDFPAGGLIWGVGPLEISQTSDFQNPGNYLQTAKSVMILPENNMMKKWRKSWHFQRTQMEYTTDSLGLSEKIFGCLQLFQASQLQMIAGASYKSGPIGMFKTTLRVQFWDERGGSGYPGNPYYVPWTSSTAHRNSFELENDHIGMHQLPTQIWHDMYRNFIPFEIPRHLHDEFMSHRDSVRLQMGLHSDYPPGMPKFDPELIGVPLNVFPTKQFDPDPDPLKRKWRGTPEQVEALRNERDAMGMNQRGRDKVQKMCEEFDELG